LATSNGCANTWASSAGRCSAAAGINARAGLRAEASRPRHRTGAQGNIPAAPPELEWFYQSSEGAASLFPDLWEQYIAPIPEEERYDMMGAYYRRLTSSDAAERNAAARAWSIWEGATSHLRTDPGYVSKFRDAEYAAAFARIECHYFVNGGFLDADDQLLRDVPKIRHIPAVIVQGRYDVICPMRSAWHLHRAWPEAELVVVPDAGHSAFEPGIAPRAQGRRRVLRAAAGGDPGASPVRSLAQTGRLQRPEALRVEGAQIERLRRRRGDEPEMHYPADARSQGIDGLVMVDLLITPEGLCAGSAGRHGVSGRRGFRTGGA
jgi:pimeloyl-ACP methyl ester carboxylesterase